MDVMDYQILCLLIVTHTTCGLLSEYKICGDEECESRMSRVQAIQDHNNNDCRFLNFRRGEIIFVYHKLTGEREDLWAGSIDRKFGYFPKDAVKEEEIYTTSEKVLETQRSDFFCIDENGYPIDTSELDNNGNIHLPETSQTQHSSSQEPHQTCVNTKTKSEQEDDNKEVETLNEQGGSPSWLESSLTGLWELEQKNDDSIPKEDRKADKDESSLTSSFIGFLGFKANKNGDNIQETNIQDTKASSTLGSSVTTWQRFSHEAKDQEDYANRVKVDESVEVYRGRKINLDLQEDTQFHPEEKTEKGTLDWIGNGILSTLGLGVNTKESRQESASDETEKESKPESSSWFDIGITDMLRYESKLADGNDQIQKDSPSAKQDNDVLPCISSLKQQEAVVTETVQTAAKDSINTSLDTDVKESNDEYNHSKSETINDVQINENVDSDPEINKIPEVNPYTSEETSNENELSQMRFDTVNLKDQKGTNEDTALSTNEEPHQNSQVIYDQDSVQLEQDYSNIGLLTEQSDENTQNDLEFEMSEAKLTSDQGEPFPERVDDLVSKVSEKEKLQLNLGQEVQDKSNEENQEEVESVIMVNGIQEVVNEKTDMGKEVIETKQDAVGKDRAKDALRDDETAETELSILDLDQRKTNVEQGASEEQANERDWNKLDVSQGNNQNDEEGSERESGKKSGIHESQEFVEDPHEENNYKLQQQRWQLDEVILASDVEDNREWSTIQKDEEGLQTTNDLSNIKAVDEKNNVNEKYNNRQSFNPKDIEENAYEEIYHDQRVEDAKESSGKLDGNMYSSSPDADFNITENKGETDSSTGSYKVKVETEVESDMNVLRDPTASPNINGRTHRENGEQPGLFNNAVTFFTHSANIETAALNSETDTKEQQVNIMNRDTEEHINNAKDMSTLNPKTLHKLYHNILASMNANDLEILIQIFGEHKMQFLNYILGSMDAATGEHYADTSILLDIERLLNYHMERLISPSMSGDGAEEKETSNTVIAMQKLELVLEKVKEAFNMVETEGKEQERDIGISKDKEITETEKDQRHNIKGATEPILDFNKISADARREIHAATQVITWLAVQVVSALPDDIRPGPDLYGVPWEPVIVSGLVGLVTVLVFICRCYNSVKSRMYRSKEQWLGKQVAQLLDEKCKVLETLSKVQQEYNGIEDSLRDSGVLAQTQKTIQLEAKAKLLERSKKEIENDFELLKDQLNQQREHRLEQEQQILALEENIKTCEVETKMLQEQEEQGQTTIKVYSMNSDRLQRNLGTAGEENALLQENNTHLRQQLEGWAERVSELEEEMKRCEHSHSGMLQDVATKDERIMSLTDRLLQMKAWDSDLEGEQGETNGTDAITDPQGHLQKVQKLIHAAKLNADLKSIDEDKDRIFAKLNDEVKAKEDLQGSIKDLEKEKLSLQSDTVHYNDQVQVLQQKLQIMTEMYQENELKLHRLLTVEEKERLQKEEKLTKADKNIAMAMEELNNYRQRAEEMEEELEKTKQSYQTQISSHEKKAHNNWLAARSAERELADIRRENAILRQKLTDTQFKLEAIEKDPYALDSLARPLPFRGRPSSETRAFLSPPTLMDGPANRLSPRVMRSLLEPPIGPGDMERTGGPHSDSGSISPIWERDRRGPPPGPISGAPGLPGTMAPPGYMFPESGGHVYRRPPPGSVGHHPIPGPPVEMADGLYRDNSLGPGELEHREPGTRERRTSPEADLRMGGIAPPGPAMGALDGPFPRRAPYGPPPPEYYLPRGPGGPPMPMWGPPPPGMYPPRFPPGGPPPHMSPYSGPPLRPSVSDGHLPTSIGPSQPPLPAQTQRQSSEEHTPSPQDII